MVGEEAVLNFSAISSALPPQIMEKISGLVLILKAVGIMMIVYFAYVILMGLVSFRRSRRIKFIEEKVTTIDEKLNRLLKKKKTKI